MQLLTPLHFAPEKTWGCDIPSLTLTSNIWSHLLLIRRRRITPHLLATRARGLLTCNSSLRSTLNPLDLGWVELKLAWGRAEISRYHPMDPRSEDMNMFHAGFAEHAVMQTLAQILPPPLTSQVSLDKFSFKMFV